MRSPAYKANLGARPASRAAALALAILLILASLVGCSEKEYKLEHCEFSLMLPEGFEECGTDDTYDAAATDGVNIVGVIRLSFEACMIDSIPTTMSAKKLAEYYRTEILEGIEAGETKNRGDVPYYTYVLSSSSASFTYTVTFYTSPYAYFIVTYVTPTDLYELEEEKILAYAEAVKIIP